MVGAAVLMWERLRHICADEPHGQSCTLDSAKSRGLELLEGLHDFNDGYTCIGGWKEVETYGIVKATGRGVLCGTSTAWAAQWWAWWGSYE